MNQGWPWTVTTSLLIVAGTQAYASDVDGGSVQDDGSGLISYFVTSEFHQNELNRTPPFENPTVHEATTWDPRILDQDRTETVRVLISLADPAFAFEDFRHLAGSDPASLVKSRLAQLEPAFNEAERILSHEFGQVEVLGRTWLVPLLEVRIPADALITAYGQQMSGLRSVELERETQVASSYGGIETRDATIAANLIAAGHTGQCCGRAGNKILIGIIDQGNVPIAHPGWDDTLSSPVGSSSRLWLSYNCEVGSTCQSLAAFPASNPTDHGFRVTWIAAGSIEEGQDPFHTSMTARRHRSGLASEAEIVYYHASTLAGAVRALQHATAIGIDVVNYSQSAYLLPRCAPHHDDSSMNAAIRNALDGGVLVVAGADNNLGAPACTLGYPAQRSEVVTVGALYTTPQGLNYNQSQMWVGQTYGSSYGGIPAITAGSGVTAHLAGVDLVTPSIRTGLGNSLWWTYLAGDMTGGTSYATPVVSGVAALLLDAFDSVGWWAIDKRALKANLLLLGDHWNAEANAKATIGLSRWSGAGRLRAHFPSSADLTSPWGWGWRAVSIGQGQTVEWPVGSSGPESCSIAQWKWAAHWTEFDLTSIADIDFRVIDKCPPGGGTVTLAYDTGYDIASKFTLFSGQICGKCLYMQAYGYSVPAGGRIFYSADYYHSGSTSTH